MSKDPGAISDPFADDAPKGGSAGKTGSSYLETADLLWTTVPQFTGTTASTAAGASPQVTRPGTDHVDVHFADLKGDLEIVRQKVDTLASELDTVVAHVRAVDATTGFWGEKALAVGQNDNDGTYTNANGDSFGTNPHQTKQPDENIRAAAESFGPSIRLMMEQASQQAANGLALVGQYMAQLHSSGDAYASVDAELSKIDVPAPVDPSQIKDH